jgi:hypothetical protein
VDVLVTNVYFNVKCDFRNCGNDYVEEVLSRVA